MPRSLSKLLLAAALAAGVLLFAATPAAAGRALLASRYEQFRSDGWDVPFRGDIKSVTVSGSESQQIARCESECDRTGGCDRFTLFERTCYLKNAGADTADAEFVGRGEKLFVRVDVGSSGPSKTDYDLFERNGSRGWDIRSGDIRDVAATGSDETSQVESCKRACDAVVGCDKFAFANNRCYLKDASADFDDAVRDDGVRLYFVDGRKAGASSPSSPSNPAPSSGSSGYSLFSRGAGWDIFKLGDIRDVFASGSSDRARAEFCMRECDDVRNCDSFALANGRCYLKDGSAFLSRASRVDYPVEFYVRNGLESDSDGAAPESGGAAPSGGTRDYDLFRDPGFDISTGTFRTVTVRGSDGARVEACKRACDDASGCVIFTLEGSRCELKNDSASLSDARRVGGSIRVYFVDFGGSPSSKAASGKTPSAPAPAPSESPSRSSSSRVTPDDFVHQPFGLSSSGIKLRDIRVFNNWPTNNSDIDRCAQRCIDEYGDECIYVQTDYPNGRSRAGRCTISRACYGGGCKTISSVNVRSFDKNRSNCKHPMHISEYNRYKNRLPRGADECTNITDDNKIAKW